MQSGEDSAATPGEAPAVVACSLCQSSLTLEADVSPQQLVCPSCGLEQIWTAPKPPEPEEESHEPVVEPASSDPLDRWLAGEPIVVQRSRGLKRLNRWRRRHPVRSAACATLVVTLVLAIVVPTLGYLRVSEDLKLKHFSASERQRSDERARQELLGQVREAHRQRRETEAQCALRNQEALERCADVASQYRMAIAQRLADQSQELADQKPTRAMQLAVESLGITIREGQSPIASAHQNLRELLEDFGVQTLAGHTDKISSLAFSPDGRRLASGSYDETVRVWNLVSGDVVGSSIVLRGHRNRVSCVRFTPDGRRLISGSFDSTARIWDLTASDPSATAHVLRGGAGRIGVLAISRDGEWLATGGGGFRMEESCAFLWAIKHGSPVKTPIALRGHAARIRALAISPDSRWIVTAGDDRTVRLWNFAAGNAPTSAIVLQGHRAGISAAKFSPDGRWLVTADHSTGETQHTARVWNVAALGTSDPTVLAGHTAGIRALDVSPDGRWLVTASDDSTARVWDLTARNPAANPVVLRGHTGAIRFVSISRGGRWLVTGSDDATARLWSLGDNGPSTTSVVLRGHEGRLTALAISPDDQWLATAGEDNNIRIVTLRLDSLINLARERTLLAAAKKDSHKDTK